MYCNPPIKMHLVASAGRPVTPARLTAESLGNMAIDRVVACACPSLRPGSHIAYAAPFTPQESDDVMNWTKVRPVRNAYRCDSAPLSTVLDSAHLSVSHFRSAIDPSQLCKVGTIRWASSECSFGLRCVCLSVTFSLQQDCLM